MPDACQAHNDMSRDRPEDAEHSIERRTRSIKKPITSTWKWSSVAVFQAEQCLRTQLGWDQESRGVSDFLVNLRPLFEKLAALLLEPGFDRTVFIYSQAGGIIADVLSNLHGAEVGPAHAAEMRDLRSILG
jgi:hypothetical protein